MELAETPGIVVADDGHWRVLEERRRGAEIRELTEWRATPKGLGQPRRSRQRATVHDRCGPGRHGAGERSLGADSASDFFERPLRDLDAAFAGGAFHRLVLMVPPRALGVIKSDLSPRLRAHLGLAEPHDCVHETIEEIRGRLRKARCKL